MLEPLTKHTVTPDRGKEFTYHQDLADKLKVEAYFPDPHAPWQRGTNENANGLLREYFPKGSDLTLVDRKSHEYKAIKRYGKLIQQNSRKLSDKRFYRPIFRMHLTNKEILEKILSYSQELREYYEIYQLLLSHFHEKQAGQFFGLIEDTISYVNPIFLIVFKIFLKDKDKSLNAIDLSYSNTKLEVTNSLIKVIKRNAFENFDNFKIRILIALNIKKERNKMILSRL